MKELANLTNVEFSVSDPVVTYKETVGSKSSQVCLSKSQNRHNRLWVEAEPLEEGISQAIEDKELNLHDTKELAKQLSDKYGWDTADCKKIWCFGPEETGPNMLVDKTT
mmetsp:Transcript_7269/g.6412  ORF Transcript_7269/g.6412 Transcript_7269/m.6412 type:complete len:109 (+) Transcript_7269:1645-1971(+)